MDLLIVFAVIAGVAAAARAVRWHTQPERRIKRLLHSTPPTSIARAADGEVVKIVGELVYARRSIESPLSHRDCAYYSIVVEEYWPHGSGGGEWHEVLREARGVDFYLRDESGMALIQVEGRAFPALVQDRKARISPFLRDDADLERLLRARGVAGRPSRSNVRAYEGVLEAGERVAVGGLARWEPDPDAAGGNYRETSKRLVLEASESLPLFLSDDPSAL